MDQGARLIHKQQRQAEYEAFSAWIEACCHDRELRGAPMLSPAERTAPKVDSVICHARKGSVIDSFVRNVWSQRMRCFPCHTRYELGQNNSKHKNPLQKLQEVEAKYGKELGTRQNVFREAPEATFQDLVERIKRTSKGELPLLDLENPCESLLVFKPLSKSGRLTIATNGSPLIPSPFFHGRFEDAARWFRIKGAPGLDSRLRAFGRRPIHTGQ